METRVPFSATTPRATLSIDNTCSQRYFRDNSNKSQKGTSVATKKSAKGGVIAIPAIKGIIWVKLKIKLNRNLQTTVRL